MLFRAFVEVEIRPFVIILGDDMATFDDWTQKEDGISKGGHDKVRRDERWEEGCLIALLGNEIYTFYIDSRGSKS